MCPPVATDCLMVLIRFVRALNAIGVALLRFPIAAYLNSFAARLIGLLGRPIRLHRSILHLVGVLASSWLLSGYRNQSGRQQDSPRN